MRCLFAILFLMGSWAASMAAEPEGCVVKVLPLFLDLKGHDAISPSLFDRDAYQARLREHPDDVSAIRIDVLWNARNTEAGKLKLRAELRGTDQHGYPQQAVLETNVTSGFFRSWTSLKFGGEEYKKFGALVAWHVTLWQGDKMLGEQKSFLW